MKSVLTLIILTLIAPAFSWAEPACLTAKQAEMPEIADLKTPDHEYEVGICYLAELTTGGVPNPYNRDLIVLKKDGKNLAQFETRMSITVGRISDLAIEQTSPRFIAVSYAAGEFCNGIVIFDKKLKKVAQGLGCKSETDSCHIIDLNDSNCSGTMECKDQGSEGQPPVRTKPIQEALTLCND